MSYEAINAVLAAEIQPPALKLLAVCIAHHANKDTGLAWPGVGTLARECSVSTTHLKRLIAELREAGVIELVEANPSGGAKSNVYRFNPERLCTGYIRAPGTSEFDPPAHWGSGTQATDVQRPGTQMDPKQGNPKGTPLNRKRGGAARPPADAGARPRRNETSWTAV